MLICFVYYLINFYVNYKDIQSMKCNENIAKKRVDLKGGKREEWDRRGKRGHAGHLK